jgi:hypothetical protein
MTRRVLATTVALIATCTLLAEATFAVAVDLTVVGKEITLRRTPGNPAGSLRLALDQGIPDGVPLPDGSDDPSLAGMTVTLFARGSGATASFVAAPGRGAHAWKVRATPRLVSYAYNDPRANSDPLQIRSARLRNRAPMRITAPAAGLPLDVAESAIAVRVEYGSTRICALFDPESVRRSGPGIFVARDGDANLLVNCNDETLSGECPTGICPTPTPTPKPVPPRICGGRPVTDACSRTIATKTACEQEGGCWTVTPFNPNGVCNCPTHDQGAVCDEWNDCEGQCFAPDNGSCGMTTGRCSDTELVFGCVCLAAGQGHFSWICLD